MSACLEGDENAWEQFFALYRPHLFACARKLTRDDALAEEISGSIWADLFTKRKLALYSGQGSLAGWLRTVVVQSYVDRLRQERRFVELDESTVMARLPEEPFDSVDDRLASALDRALGDLSAERRLILAAHYLDGRTFAEIGRMLGVHESSVCRQSKKSLDFVRKKTTRYLRSSGMSIGEAQRVMGEGSGQIVLDVRKRLQLVKNTP